MDKDLLSMADLTGPEVWDLMHSAVELKKQRNSSLLEGRALALVFELPSLRTRASFDVGMRQLGGQCVYLSPQEIGLGIREPASDIARVLSRYVDAIVARTRRHQTVVELAKFASVPVINGLSDGEHPCQVLADLLTIYEHKGKLGGLNIAYVGDGNNMAASLSLGAMLVGANLTMAAPEGYLLPPETISTIKELGAKNGGVFNINPDPAQAVSGADVIYTDVWTSMGQEAESERRLRDFAGYQVNIELLSHVDDNAIFMHPLPAHRGEEVSDEVMEHPCSVVFDQAGNRLHAQKAVLARLLGQS
jgi:ornithine carbamoyltransferase